MNRFRKAYLALVGRLEPEVREVETVAPSDLDGVLFGLDPPDGCHFQVEFSGYQWWHVRIMRGQETIGHGCEGLSYVGEDDEKAIVSAAKDALTAVARKERTKELEGCYPPKRAKGKR